MDSDFYAIFPESGERVKILHEKTGILDKLEMHMVLSVEADDVLSLEKVQLFYKVGKEIEEMERVVSSINPFNFITFVNDNGHFAVKQIGKKGQAPQTQRELEVFKNNLLNEPLARDVVISKDGRALNMLILLDKITDPEIFMADFREIIAPLEEDSQVYYVGDTPLAYEIARHIRKDLFVLLLLSLLVMLILLFFSFRAVRSIFFPILTILLGIIWTIGFTKMIGYELTFVSIILPTFLLAIGNSYTIHLLNEFYRNISSEKKKANKEQQIVEAVLHSTRTISLAGITTILGFLGLMVTSIRPLEEFGITLSFGILSSILLSLFFLPALLVRLPSPKGHTLRMVREGFFVGLIRKVSVLVQRRYKLLVALFSTSFVLLLVMYPKISRNVDYFEYFPEDAEVVQAVEAIIKNTGSGGGQSMNITIQGSKDKNYFLQPEVLANLDRMQDELEDLGDILGVSSFSTILKNINEVLEGEFSIPERKGLIRLLYRYFKLIGNRDISFASGAQFISTDASTITIFMKVYSQKTGRYITDEGSRLLEARVREVVLRYFPEISDYHIWGNTLLLYEGGEDVQREQLKANILSVILIFFFSCLVFKSFFQGITAILPLLVAVFMNFIIMALLGIPLDITTVLVSNVAVGVGVDDSLHFLLQLKRQRKKYPNWPLEEHIDKTLLITGRPIILTTLTIVAGFMMLNFASFKPIIYFGTLVSISLFSAMVATLLFLPAFILLFKSRQNNSQDKVGDNV